MQLLYFMLGGIISHDPLFLKKVAVGRHKLLSLAKNGTMTKLSLLLKRDYDDYTMKNKNA